MEDFQLHQLEALSAHIEGLEAALEALDSDKSLGVSLRRIATDALRALNDLPSVDVATQVLDAETDRDLVSGCLRIVRHLGHRDHVPLVRPLVESTDPVIRATAVGTLGAIGGPAEVPLLQDRLDDDAFWISREAARGLMALGEVETLRQLAASEGPWAVLAQEVLSE